MSKRHVTDYDEADVATYLAEAQGYTLDAILALDFPEPDYYDEGRARYWTFNTVWVWLEVFNKARLTSEIAADPETLDNFAALLRQLPSFKEKE